MSRQSSIVCSIVVFAFAAALFGCSSATNPTVVPHSGAAGIQVSPQSRGSWTTKAPMPTARWGLAAGVVNGILYAVGGCGAPNSKALNTVEAYDPTTDSWTTKAPMPTARAGFAVGVINGVLYAVGGWNNNIYALSKVEAYDPATDTWSTKARMPTARNELAVGVVNGKLYAVGGHAVIGRSKAVEVYDPSTNTWTTEANSPR